MLDLDDVKRLISQNSFTYNFVKIGLFAAAGICLFEVGKLFGYGLKLFLL